MYRYFVLCGAPFVWLASVYPANAQSPVTLQEIEVRESVPGSFPPPITQPAGQTLTTIDSERFKASPLFSIGDLLLDSPGVSVKQGNGPRDQGISIRGSNARNGFGVKNIVVFEDGFPVTQPDGLSRTDLTDPNAYGGVDVYRGPSSAMFGNYATGGAINFKLRPGREINGGIYGFDAGSFNYFNNYALIGGKGQQTEGSLFASDARGTGAISHSKYNTQTVNGIVHFQPTADDTLTFKVINNYVLGYLPLRQSLNQFQANPYQQGCGSAAGAAAGCPTVTLGGVNQTADQGNFNRHDRRTVMGARWAHDFDNTTTWRTQFVFDDRNINQPTGTTSAVGDFPSINAISDITKRGQFFGLDSTYFGAVFYNRMRSHSDTLPVLPGGNTGAVTSNATIDQYNTGARGRQEVTLGAWTAAWGAGYEYSNIYGVNTTFAGGAAPIVASRNFENFAPEFALRFKPDAEWQFRGRISTGYGIPQGSNLFVTPAGVAGNNTNLKAQQNVGYDVGVDWTPANDLKLSVTGFYEFFQNELVTQSPGVGLTSFTFNAPRSVHRGVEMAADWRFRPGWRFVLAYTYNDQFYTEYNEQLTTGAISATFNRAGNKIPGIAPHEATARLGYDQIGGALDGLGSYVEYVYKDAFFMENGNLLRAPGYQLVNLNIHYDRTLNDPIVKGFTAYAEVRNIFDTTYVASANNITNTLAAGGVQSSGAVLAGIAGSIYAGSPRTFLAGLRLRI
jgi:iron complex outermembrane receptor protein